MDSTREKEEKAGRDVSLAVEGVIICSSHILVFTHKFKSKSLCCTFMNKSGSK